MSELSGRPPDQSPDQPPPPPPPDDSSDAFHRENLDYLREHAQLMRDKGDFDGAALDENAIARASGKDFDPLAGAPRTADEYVRKHPDSSESSSSGLSDSSVTATAAVDMSRARGLEPTHRMPSDQGGADPEADVRDTTNLPTGSFGEGTQETIADMQHRGFELDGIRDRGLEGGPDRDVSAGMTDPSGHPFEVNVASTATERGEVADGQEIQPLPVNVEGTEPKDSKLRDALNSPELRPGLDASWQQSRADDPINRHEEGGWIIGNTETGEMRFSAVPSGERAAIAPGQPPDLRPHERVEGFYHTHPNPDVDETGRTWEPGLSDADKDWADYNRVPIVARSADEYYVYYPR